MENVAEVITSSTARDGSIHSFAPTGLTFIPLLYPRITPCAAFFRRFAAQKIVVFHFVLEVPVAT